MCITINTMESCTDLPDCVMAGDIRLAMLDDKHVGMLSEFVFHG